MGSQKRNLAKASLNPADRGETLYFQYCAACHGAQGEGYLAVEALPLDATGETWKLSEAEVERVILEGRGVMPGFGEKLTELDIADLLETIQAMWTEEQQNAFRDNQTSNGSE
jgi:mono/diheme cytochrome c family protein